MKFCTTNQNVSLYYSMNAHGPCCHIILFSCIYKLCACTLCACYSAQDAALHVTVSYHYYYYYTENNIIISILL